MRVFGSLLEAMLNCDIETIRLLFGVVEVACLRVQSAVAYSFEDKLVAQFESDHDLRDDLQLAQLLDLVSVQRTPL